MPFDNEAFTGWLKSFETALRECGMPERTVLKYRTDYYSDAVAYFAKGTSADDAAAREVLGF